MARCSVLVLTLALAAGACATSTIETRERSGECVFVLHGLARRASSMAALASELAGAGFVVDNVAYPSTSAPFEAMVAALGAAVDRRGDSCSRAHFVGYSLGALVVRAYLAHSPPSRLGNVVLIAPPNHGTEIVDAIGRTWLFRKLMGSVATELGTAPDSLPHRLPRPGYPVGVIAGDRILNLMGWIWIPGVHDGTVSVASTRLDGMTDFLLVHRTHTFIMQAPEVADQTIAFLRHGQFRPTPSEP